MTGVLLVGGASRRFGSPKALARLGGESLAERAWRVLGEACEERIAVGKTADGLPLPFPVLDDHRSVRAPIAGVVAGLRAARQDICVFLPVDCPLLTAAILRRLAEACAGFDAAVPVRGPLPGAYSCRALPVLEQNLRAGRLTLRDALAELQVRRVPVDPAFLVNVNTQDELRALEPAPT